MVANPPIKDWIVTRTLDRVQGKMWTSSESTTLSAFRSQRSKGLVINAFWINELGHCCSNTLLNRLKQSSKKQKSPMAERRLANCVEQKFNHRQKILGGDRRNPQQLPPPMVTVQLCVVVTTILGNRLKMRSPSLPSSLTGACKIVC